MKNKIQSLGLALLMATGSLGTVAVIGTGCAGDKYHQSTGEYIDDASITSRVKDALSDDPQYRFHDVNVDTFKGTVQLSGFVESSDQKSRAEKLAKGVNGVKDVVNNISVK